MYIFRILFCVRINDSTKIIIYLLHDLIGAQNMHIKNKHQKLHILALKI